MKSVCVVKAKAYYIIKERNDCYKMSHSHLITIEKVNRHYILYFRDRMIKSFPTLTAAKQYGDFFN